MKCPTTLHDDLVKWKYFPRYWPFVWGIHRSIPSQRLVTRSFDVLFVLYLNHGWVNNREAADLRWHRAHYGVIVMGLEPLTRPYAELFCMNLGYWKCFQLRFTRAKPLQCIHILESRHSNQKNSLKCTAASVTNICYDHMIYWSGIQMQYLNKNKKKYI